LVRAALGFSPRPKTPAVSRVGCDGTTVYEKLPALPELLVLAGECAIPTDIVGDIHITDTAAYQAHVPRALATIARFGGRVVAGGGRVDVLEGDPMTIRRR